MYKIFRRKVWVKTPGEGWPNDYEPLAVSMDDSEVIHNEVQTEKEAREICRPLNENWRRAMDKVERGTASGETIREYYESYRYEYHEIDPVTGR